MPASKRKMKTVATRADPIAFIDKVGSETKRKDAHELVAMMQDATGAPPTPIAEAQGNGPAHGRRGPPAHARSRALAGERASGRVPRPGAGKVSPGGRQSRPAPACVLQ